MLLLIHNDISKMNHKELERRDEGRDDTQARELALKFIKKKLVRWGGWGERKGKGNF